MLSVWRFLSGNVPGGMALLLVVVIAFVIVWLFVYRAGQTLKERTFRRWLWRMPLIFLLIYFIFWIQSPPKMPPSRIAVVAGVATPDQEWACSALADLTARRLRRALPNAVVNPWEGAEDYPQPPPDVLQRSGYKVFQVGCEPSPAGSALNYTISNLGGAQRTLAATGPALLDLSAQMYDWVISQFGKKLPMGSAFYRNPATEVLEAYYRGRWALLVSRTDSLPPTLMTAIQMDSLFWPAKIWLGRAYEANHRREEASAAYLGAAQADTVSFEAMLALGEYYLRIFEWEVGEAALKVVLTKNPTSARAAAGLAKIHPDRLKDLRLNSPQELLAEALRLDPAYERARVMLADLLADKGLPESAAKLLREGLDLHSNSEDLLLKLGAVEIQLGRPEAARENYDLILKSEPLNRFALFNLGVVDYKTKQYDQALERFKAVQGLKGPVDCYYYLGLIYQTKGDSVRARFYFQKRWELRSSDEDAFGIKARDMAARLED